MGEFRKAQQKRSDSPPIKSKFVESNLYGQPPPPKKKASNKENSQKENSQNTQPPVVKQKTGGNFLTNGEGRGGGRGKGGNDLSY